MPENQDIIGTALTSQLIFVDFDGTVCLHLFPVNYRQDEIWHVDSTKAYNAVFAHSLPNKKLIRFLEEAHNRGATIILLSSASSRALEMKIKWLNIHCPNVFGGYIAVQSHEEKIACAESYIKMRTEYPNSKYTALIIDDSSDVLRRASHVGITALSPSTITEIFER